MRMLNKSIKSCLVLTLAAASSMLYAAQEADIESLEKKLVGVETEMLTPELRLDDLQKQRSEYDGVSGWFQGSKKKALDAEISKETSSVESYAKQMNDLSKQVQSMVFEVAKSFESRGDYDKAIEYYLKVSNRNDTVKERISICYKAKKDYTQAIKWRLEMKRTDKNLLDVVDCYHLDKNDKSAIYWLFEILGQIDGSPEDLKALKLIEEYKYNGLKEDYPDFYYKLADIYIKKAFVSYKNSTTQAASDYKKAVSLVKEDNAGKSLSSISLAFVNDYQEKYSEALEILSKQREAAERNFQDKVKNADRKIFEAEESFKRARHNSGRHYEEVVRRAENSLKQAEDRLRQLNANPQASQGGKDNAKKAVERARGELDRIRRDREKIIRDYIRPYERDVKDAIFAKEKLIRDRSTIISNYIAPYEKNVSDAKSTLQTIKNLHNANFK